MAVQVPDRWYRVLPIPTIHTAWPVIDVPVNRPEFCQLELSNSNVTCAPATVPFTTSPMKPESAPVPQVRTPPLYVPVNDAPVCSRMRVTPVRPQVTDPS